MEQIDLSIIVPSFNEENYIAKCLKYLHDNISGLYEFEVLIVDAMSIDSTISAIEELGFNSVRLIIDAKLRFKKYAALNEGAKHAKGDVLIFLDADTLLPRNFDLLIMQVLTSKVVGGAFNLEYDIKPISLELVLLFNKIRYRISKHFYGDQAVFCKKEAFETVGGFPKVNVLETAGLCKRLKKKGKLYLVPTPVITSSRRFLKGGVFSVFMEDLAIWLRNKLSLSVSDLGTKYWESGNEHK